MTDSKAKKIKIYKLASEINVTGEQLLEFLQKKGHAVKTIMSTLTDEMMNDINNHFKKDIEKAEKHNKKVAEFKKNKPEKQKDREYVKEEVEVQEEAHALEVSPEIISNEIEEIPAVEQPEQVFEVPVEESAPITIPVETREETISAVEEVVPEAIREEIHQVIEETIQTVEAQAPEVTQEELKQIVNEEVVEKEIVQISDNKDEEPASDLDIQLNQPEEVVPEKPKKLFVSPNESNKVKGLTVLGKIDLSEKPKRKDDRKDFRGRQDDRRRGKDDRPARPDDRPQRTTDRTARPEDRRPDDRRRDDNRPPRGNEERRFRIEDRKPGDRRFENKPDDKRFENRKFEDITLSFNNNNVIADKSAGIGASPASDPNKKKKKVKTVKKKTPDVVDDNPVVKKKKRVKKFEIDQKEVKETIRKTLLSMDESTVGDRASLRKKKRKEREAAEEKIAEQRLIDSKKIAATEFIAVNELANLMNVSVSEVISKCIQMGLMVSINQRLDVETITLVADEFGFEVEFQKEYTAEALEDKQDEPDSLEPRSPVVTIMGHVDHGKTSLLDYIRNSNVVAGESGGITQHIGAYKVDVGNGKKIAFLDTPGHEAFTAMRARGAQLTDIVVLVVAADDAVMPQTVEAINHAQAANVPMVIAMNKIDKPGANTEKIKQQLAERNILVEEWGGKYQYVELSAKTGLNVDLLLEKILLEADLLDLKANPNRTARGAVVESELDKGRGITATVLVQKGTLRIGDPFVAGIYHGKVRAMFDERGNKVSEVPPSTPVLVVGFEGAPQAGDTFVVVDNERMAREVSIKRQHLKREQDQKQIHHITLDEIAKQISIGGVKELPLIVKGDVDGSVEALSDSLMKLSNEEVIVRVIHKGVGGISESDVLLAAASQAIIVGFHVRPNLNARKLAETQKVDIRLYNVIYDAINEVKSALEGLLSPVLSEEVVATLDVRDTFKVPKAGTVAGCFIQDGKITRNSRVRLVREGIVIHEGDISSLKRFKDDVREVDAGYECGISLSNYNDIKIGDVIEAFKIIETKKKL